VNVGELVGVTVSIKGFGVGLSVARNVGDAVGSSERKVGEAVGSVVLRTKEEPVTVRYFISR
jgi:hypothetical protein